MKIITLANQKGGCGKSTIALNLSMNLTLNGKKVILFDTDPQISCIETIQQRKDYILQVVPIFEDIHKEVINYQNKTDYIIIDTPPHNGATMASAIICSDLVIIPVQDSPLDVRSTKATVDLVKDAKEINESLKIYFILSRIQPKTVLAKELAELLRKTYGFDILKTEIANRVAYKYSMIYGQGVNEFDKKDLASEEINSLVKEILEILE